LHPFILLAPMRLLQHKEMHLQFQIPMKCCNEGCVGPLLVLLPVLMLLLVLLLTHLTSSTAVLPSMGPP